MGYESPMPVQEEVIPFLLGDGNDVIALAQTGTGKTAAFGLPILQKIDVTTYHPQALVLCPTRELCLQIADDLNDYSKYIDNLKVLPVYGGSSIESQIKTLKRGVHVVVATPGRLLDLMNRKTVDLSLVKNVIMDEADEMLNMGFTDSINAILAEVPENRNMLLFSATMPKEIANITKKYMKNPKEIVIGNKNEGNKNIRDIYYMVQARDKYLALKRIADFYPNIYGIVFCRTRKETQEIADKLIQDGYNADSLHGELSQAQRDYVMQKFRVKNIQLLVATDVAARGLDVDDLTHVINYGLPDVDGTTTCVDVAHHIAHVLFRSTHFHGHDRLEDDRLGLRGSFLEAHGTCDLEGHFGGIDVVDLAVGDGSLDANHREAGEDAGFHGFLHASIDGRNEFLGDVAAGDFVDELVGLAVLGVERLEVHQDLCELAGTTGLLLVRVFLVHDGLADRLAVCNLRVTDVAQAFSSYCRQIIG